MEYITLVLLFAKVSLLTFGSGLASLPFLYQVFVVEEGWLTTHEFSSTIALAQMTPGPIILNSATLIGYRKLGFAGSILGTASVVVAPLMVVMLLDWIFKSASGRIKIWVDRIRIAMRPVVAGLLLVSLWTVTVPVLRKTVLWGITGLTAVLYFTVPFLRKYPQALLFGMAILTTVLYAFGVLSFGV